MRDDNTASMMGLCLVLAGFGLLFGIGYGKDLAVERKDKQIMEVKHDAEVDYWREKDARNEGLINGLLINRNGGK